MTESLCNYPGKRDEALVAYLYGEMATDERAAFDWHILVCALCRAELADLADVRLELSQWAPPEPATQVPLSIATLPQPVTALDVVSARHLPVWAQAIAATLMLGAAGGIANLDVSYRSAAGLSIRTGWKHSVVATGTPVAATPAAVVQAPPSPAPWTSDVAALERQLRAALDARPTAATATSSISDDAVMRRVGQLIQESERRQQTELALRVAEVAREVQAQRQADLVKIDRTLGVMQSRTGIEVMRTQRQVNSLAQQVSQRP
jgi:hypothetical protein